MLRKSGRQQQVCPDPKVTEVLPLVYLHGGGADEQFLHAATEAETRRQNGTSTSTSPPDAGRDPLRDPGA
jgi:hypothetical protein